MSTAALQTLLGLTDEELLTVLGSDPISVITGEEDTRPEIRILMQLMADLEPSVLRRWVRTGPLQLLLRQDFAGFEDALADLSARGFVISRPDPDASRRARPR